MRIKVFYFCAILNTCIINIRYLGLKTIGDKIEFLREIKGLTQESLAKIVEVSPGAVSKWEQDISKPKAKSMTKLADYFNVTLASLMNEKCPIKYESKLVYIPFYNNVQASAGYGFEAENEDYDDLCIQASFIPNPKQTIALKIMGDSMMPIFSDGSIVFIDKDLCDIIDGQVYVFIHEGMVRMKILENIPKGFKFKSYNPNYKDEEINIGEEHIKIIGKVIGQIQMY